MHPQQSFFFLDEPLVMPTPRPATSPYPIRPFLPTSPPLPPPTLAKSPPPAPLPPPPPPPPAPAPEPNRRPSLRERFRSSFPGLAARLSASSRGSGRSHGDPVLPRAQTRRFFNSDNMLAPRRPRPGSAQLRAPLGPPLSPPPTQPLPPTPTSESAAKEQREREAAEREGKSKAKPKVRPLPPVPELKTPPVSVPHVVLRPNRLGEPGLPQQHQPRQQQGHQQEAVVLVPRGGWRDGISNVLPPPAYTSPAYGTRSRP